MKTIVRRLKRPDFTLYPLSDVHWPRHDHDRLAKWRDAVVADDSALVTFGGDMFDFARGTYRKHLESYHEDETSRDPLDEMAAGWVEEATEYLRPIAHKVIAVVSGNHYHQFRNGRTSDQELAIKLGIAKTFAGALALVRIDLPWRGRRVPVIVALHHDAGRRGGTESADLLAFVHWSRAVDADVYIAGHTHEGYVKPARARLTMHPDEDKLRARKAIYIRASAFAKSYPESITSPLEPVVPSYPELRMLPPATLSVQRVSVHLDALGHPCYRLAQELL